MKHQPKDVKQSNNNFRVIGILTFGIFALWQVIYQADNSFLFEDELNFIFWIFALPYFLFVIYRDTLLYSITKSWKSYTATIIGFTFIPLFILFSDFLEQLDKSPILFSMTQKDSNFGGIIIEFREDGSYKLGNYFLGAEFYRGKYALKDSFIEIKDVAKASMLENNKFVIGNQILDSLNERYERPVYEIDNIGQRIENCRFRIIDEKEFYFPALNKH